MSPMLRNVLLATVFLAACGTTRSASKYRDDTASLIQPQNAAIETCYDGVLKSDASAAGTVVVKFKVEAKTGKVVDVAVDEGATTAPAALGQCVVDALGGLVLDPPDKKTGDATFSWSFQAQS